MKKEIIVAIIVGLGIGLVITYGIYRAQQAYQNTDTVNNPGGTPVTQTSPATPEATVQHKVLVTSPQDDSVQNQATISVTGTTTPTSYITVVSDSIDEVGQANEQGQFSIEVALEAGANVLTVTAIDEQGNQASQDLTIVFSTANLNDATSNQKTES